MSEKNGRLQTVTKGPGEAEDQETTIYCERCGSPDEEHCVCSKGGSE